jgi:hypothetical protein
MENMGVSNVLPDCFIKGNDVVVELMVAVLELSLDVPSVCVKFSGSFARKDEVNGICVFCPDSGPFSICPD